MQSLGGEAINCKPIQGRRELKNPVHLFLREARRGVTCENLYQCSKVFKGKLVKLSLITLKIKSVIFLYASVVGENGSIVLPLFSLDIYSTVLYMENNGKLQVFSPCQNLAFPYISMLHTISDIHYTAVLRIHDILGRIRIMPLTNGSGSGSCYFHH